MLAPAFPRLGRVTRGGVQHVDDQPAHEHEIWRLELKPPPREIVALLEGLLGLAVGVDVVRGAVEELAACLRGAAARVVTVDAETDEDLDRLIDGVNASRSSPGVGGLWGLVCGAGKSCNHRGAASQPETRPSKSSGGCHR